MRSNVSFGGMVVTVLALGPGASAQEPTPVKFSGTPVTAAHEFSSITALRELSDGRVLVTDSKDKELRLFDRELRISKTLGRTGAGPKEFSMAGALYPLAADTTLLYDAANSRYLPIHPDGSLGETIPFPEPTGSYRFVSTGLGGTTWIDHRRRNCTLQRIAVGMPGVVPSDSAPLNCGSITSSESRAVAKLKQPEMRNVESGQPGVRMMQSVRFDTQDGWAVSPEGSIVIVRSNPYRVEWLHSDRAPVIGPPVPYTPIRPTKDEIERMDKAIRDQLARGGGPTVSASRSGAPVSTGAAMAKADLPSRDVKPPFEATMTVAGPDNTVWVKRHVADGKATVYDVFDARGERIRSVEIPANRAKVIAVGRHGVYLVRVDDDGLQYLERWTRPW